MIFLDILINLYLEQRMTQQNSFLRALLCYIVNDSFRTESARSAFLFVMIIFVLNRFRNVIFNLLVFN